MLVCCRWWRWFWFTPPLFKEISEAVSFINSLLVSIEMIVMGKYVLIEGMDRESVVVDWGLMHGTPINVFWMNEDHITTITF
jgi:hypothetical protein